jgi:PAS domain S-box-containing protein
MGRSELTILLGIAGQSIPAHTGGQWYYLFESGAQLFAIVISACLFIIVWNSRRFIRNDCLVFVGISCLFVAIIDGLALSVSGGHSGLWQLSRYVQATSFVIAPFVLGRRLSFRAVLTVYGTIVVLLAAGAFGGVLPQAWKTTSDAAAWSQFWTRMDILTGVLFVASAYGFHRKKMEFHPSVARLLVASALVFAGSEWAMAMHPRLGMPADIVSHCLQVAGFYVIYKAVVETGLVRPYQLMFLNLQQNEAMLKQALDESRRQKAETDALLHGTRHIISDLGFDETAGGIVLSCRQLLGAELAHFTVLQQDGTSRMLFMNGDSVQAEPATASGWEDLTRKVLSAMQPLCSNDAGRDGLALSMPVGAAQVRNLLMIPLIDRGMPFGTLAMANRTEGFSRTDVELVTAFGELVAIALHDRRTHEELAESEKKFRGLVSHVPGAVYRSSFRDVRTMEFISGTIEEISGYPASDFTNSGVRSYQSIIHNADVEMVQRCIHHAIETAQPYSVEYRITTATGETRWVRDHGCGNYDENGTLLALDGAIFDVTIARLAEQEIQESRRLLEVKIAQRTAELRKANELLEAQIQERRTLEQLVLRASEREQQRIGQELHDGLGQELAGLAFMIGALAKRLSTKLPQEKKNTHDILELVQKAINEIRGVAKGLYPVEVRSGGLHSALGELATNTRRLFSLACTFSSDEPFEVHDAAVATHIYRIAQEAINNAIKHGKARNISIHLKKSPDHAILTVSNDGLAFGTEPVGPTGMGMQIMKYRADVIGGVLEVASEKDGLTVVKCTFPNESDLVDEKAQW